MTMAPEELRRASALELARLGFGIIRAQGKKPVVPKLAWNTNPLTGREVVENSHILQPELNTGTVPAPGCCIIDIDNKPQEDGRQGIGDESLLRLNGGPFDSPLICFTGSGLSSRHIYCQCDPARKLARQPAGELGGIETIAYGKHQGLIAGSIHDKTGNVYRWAPGKGPSHVLAVTDLPQAPEWAYEQERKVEDPPQSKTEEATLKRERLRVDNREEFRTRKYLDGMLEGVSSALASTGKNNRNNALNNSAMRLGHFAHHGVFTEDTAWSRLSAACMKNGEWADPQGGPKKCRSTFLSGWRAGFNDPQPIPEGDQQYQNTDAPPPPPPGDDAKPQDEPKPGYAPWAREVILSEMAVIPPRQWLYGAKLIRGFTSVFASPGGVGKTAHSFAAGVAMAAGLQLHRDLPHKPLRVWIYNMEDPFAELQRRLKAALAYFELDPVKVLPNLFMNSGKDRRGDGEDGCLKLVSQEGSGTIIVGPDVDKLIHEINRLKIDVFWADPFIMTHDVEESDNRAQERVMREYNRVATDANCAIALNHHTRKGFVAGDQDSIRGAGAIIAAARAGFTLAPMSEKDAEDMNVGPEEQRFLVRLDDAKLNLAPRSDRAQWFKLASHNIGNATPEYPQGDNVQVFTVWDPPEDGRVSTSFLNEVLDLIDQGSPTGDLYVKGKRSENLWAGQCFYVISEKRGIKLSDAMISRFLADWIKNNVLVQKPFTHSSRRHKLMGLVSNLNNRPGKEHNT